ncbi:RimK family alpha-L-glutamate ligase [Marinicella sp. W31]|uniref:ATP-grasp domain-containing protein n=1 Tax=Marinicella sp. W31 TaxID=3023713 RepID=UPI0037575FA9
MAYDVIILTEDRYENPQKRDWYTLQIMLEEELLKHALQQAGLKTAVVSWSNPDFDWRSTQAILFKSTWDYFHRFDEFSAWLEQVKHHTKAINPIEIIEWNLNKKYLIDLHNKGIRIVDSLVIEQGQQTALEPYFEQFNVSELIVKPLVSGAARHTYKVNASNLTEVQKNFDQLIQAEGFLIQPFQQNVITQGEISLMIMGGEFTHAIQKIAKPGDFRVQDDFGGTVHPYFANAEEIKFAEQAVAACDPMPLYARVDVIRDNNNQLALMELELIEPEVFFRFNQAATFKLADAVVDFLNQN